MSNQVVLPIKSLAHRVNNVTGLNDEKLADEIVAAVIGELENATWQGNSVIVGRVVVSKREPRSAPKAAENQHVTRRHAPAPDPRPTVSTDWLVA